MNEPVRLDVVSDAICPWCWIGKRQFEAARPALAAAGLDVVLHWRPYQLNPDMPAAGVARAAYRAAKFGSAERGRTLDAGVTAAGAAVGLEFRFDRVTRTPNTVDAHRLIRAADAAGVQDAVVEALFHAYFVEGRDIGDGAVLAEVAATAGMDAAGTAALLRGTAHRAEVVAEDATLRGAGVSGVPSFVLGRHVLFSGALPAETMVEAITAAHAALAGRDAA